MSQLDQFLQNSTVIVSVGTGGVGKTTVSAALGVRAAELGLKTLVLTIDPAQRLKTSLGLSAHQKGPRPVKNKASTKLYAELLHPESAFREFILEHISDQGLAKKIFSNPLFYQLTTSLSGTQEFTSLDRLYRASREEGFDLVILDTPPAQHAIDFLNAPERLYALFQDSVTKWFIQSKVEREGLITRLISRSTTLALRAFEKMTGADFIQRLSDFFSSIESIQGFISQRSLEVQRMLLGPSVGFLLVTGFDEVKLQEAAELYSFLKRGGYRLSAVIINRAFPVWPMELEPKTSPGSAKVDRLRDFYKQLSSYYKRKQEAMEDFEGPFSGRCPVIRVPEFTQDLYGYEALEKMAQELSRRW